MRFSAYRKKHAPKLNLYMGLVWYYGIFNIYVLTFFKAINNQPNGLVNIWMFPKIGGKPPKWMVKIMENPIKIHDLGVTLFLETPIYVP